jgi:predicted membrane protein DUF2339
MMAALALLALAIIAIAFRRRMDSLERRIYELGERLDAIEHPPKPAPVPPRIAPRPVPLAVPAPVAAAAPVAAPAPVAPAAPVASVAVVPVAHSMDAPVETLESRIGGHWLLYIGVIAIVIGIAYFEKLAIDNRWLSETWRVIQGGLIGLLLVGGGLLFVRKGYCLYGQILSGAGVAVLYVSIYAAFNFYHLIRQPVAFALMTIVTALGAWLADVQRSQGLALVAVAGGFATPFLLPSTSDAEAALLGYDTFLIGGTLALSRRRDWPTLNVVSYAFTVLTVLAWASRFYTPAKYLTTELFLTVFCVMFLYILRQTAGSRHPSANAERAILWTAPFGYYLASLAILAEHSPALLVYLTVLSLVGVVVGARTISLVRLAFWMITAAPLLVWTDIHMRAGWLAPGLAVWGAVYALNLVGLLEATVVRERTFDAADIVLLHLNPLVAYAGAFLLVHPVRAALCAPAAAAFASVNFAIAALVARRSRDEALHFAAVAFTLLVIAAGLQFEGPWITAAWAGEGAVVVWLGLSERRAWLRAAGLLLFTVAILQYVALQLTPPPVGQVLLLNRRAACGTFLILLTYAIAFAHHHYGRRSVEAGFGLITAKLLILVLAAGEIGAYWTLHPAPRFEPAAQIIIAALIVGAAIMWLALWRHEEPFRAVGAAVIAVAAAGVFAIQMEPAPAGYAALFNDRAASGLVAVLVLAALAFIHRRLGSHVTDLPTNVGILTTSASLLTLSLLTSEINAYWALRGAPESWSISREALHVIAWSGIGGFLIWNGLVNARGWIRAIGATLLVTGVLRLVGLQFAAPGPAYAVVANARVMASIVLIALLYGLAHLYRGADVVERQLAASTILSLVANALTLTLATSEITAYWRVHDLHTPSTYTGLTSHFAREVMLSITWAVYALVLVVVGLWRGYAPIRYFAMTVFVITIVKVFAIDLAELERIYRVMSVIGLGVTLLLTSYLYQRLSASERRAG